MKKNVRLRLLVLLLLPCLAAGCRSATEKENAAEETSAALSEAEKDSVRDDPLWADPDSMTAVIVSDLHYTQIQGLDHSLVPGIALAQEITDAILEEVLDRHPDVLIMTGDNTNTGDPADVSALVKKLQRLRDAGIGIILITGNHDFDLMDAAAFESAYFGLLDPVDRDPASLSYTSIVKDVVFLAMDDNAVRPGGQGEFSAKTMKWLEDMLDKYRGRKIIFLSHHNVQYGYGEEDTSFHLIQNPELPSLLRDKGVCLAFTGHMHFQYIMEKDGLWEVLSGMPFSGGHFIGNLAVSRGRALYYADPVDFASYGKMVETASAGADTDTGDADTGQKNTGNTDIGDTNTGNTTTGNVDTWQKNVGNKITLQEELERLDQENAASMEQIFTAILEREGVHGVRRKKTVDLISKYMLYYADGTLAEHTEELRKDPACKGMIRALWDYNYGPWMKEMIETTTHSARELEVVFPSQSDELP